MKSSDELYKLVYDYFSIRIRFGFYACNDSLPSMPKICARFHLAIPTVRTALAQLERDKYIRVEAARAARVIYDAKPEKVKKLSLIHILSASATTTSSNSSPFAIRTDVMDTPLEKPVLSGDISVALHLSLIHI